jgi:hypothetical protein
MEPNNGNSTALKNALNAVQLCNVAMDFNPVKDIGRLMPGWKIVWNGGKVSDPNYVFVAVDDTGQNYALVIRGSVNAIFSDWDVFVDWAVEDLDVAFAYWPFASTSLPCVSAGAYIAFTSMLLMQDTLGSQQFLIDYLLANVVGKGKQLVITGHSLGGNVANVYTSYFVETLKRKGLSTNNISLFTFAAPASGNGDFVKDLDDKLPTAWHYQNTNDAIPNFPVPDGLGDTGNLYSPQPAASLIDVTFQEKQYTLKEVFDLLGIIFLKANYQQPNNNYVKFTAKLDTNFVDNTIQNWLSQAGQQHQLFNYAGYFGLKLPSITGKPVVHAV